MSVEKKIVRHISESKLPSADRIEKALRRTKSENSDADKVRNIVDAIQTVLVMMNKVSKEVSVEGLEDVLFQRRKPLVDLKFALNKIISDMGKE